MSGSTTARGTYVHDRRHRYSVELRPDHDLDAALRSVAVELEAAGLLLPGASTAPRFHPHLTVTRSAVVDAALVDDVTAALEAEHHGPVSFHRADTFGAGRIVFVEPRDDTIARRARALVLDRLDERDVDPLVFQRDWTPHVTLAYAVPEAHRAAVLHLVREHLPIDGRFATIEAWDLDVRPTRLVHAGSL